ncbi:alpha/beta hydrolase [Clostridium acetobutylicum]|nr:alpha/beta hydrolase [Clostridium acetobutylicum]
MIVEGNNCKHCDEFKNKACNGEVNDCMCKKCPRNLGQCIVTKYCRETESIIYINT